MGDKLSFWGSDQNSGFHRFFSGKLFDYACRTHAAKNRRHV